MPSSCAWSSIEEIWKVIMNDGKQEVELVQESQQCPIFNIRSSLGHRKKRIKCKSQIRYFQFGVRAYPYL